MVITKGEEMIKEKVKTLWRLCFDDSEEFIELYFCRRYSDNANRIIRVGEEIVSALQLISYPMTFCNHCIQTSYVSGGCTHPDHRGRGYMQQLFAQSLVRMQQEEVVLSTLIPAEAWLFDFYARMGYASVFRYAEIDLSFVETAPDSEIIIGNTENDVESAYTYLNRKMAERSCCLQHSFDDFETLLAAAVVNNEQIYTAYRKQEVVGIVFAGPQVDQLQIQELLAEDEEARNALLHHIQESNANTPLSLIAPPLPGNERLIGMARIINAEVVLQQYAAAHPAYKASVALTDELIEANNRFFYIENGQCTASRVALSDTHTPLDVRELCEQLLLPLHPYMSLMLN